jgi:cold shock CspA family protein/ribosome-associated translation inhibitor RaiA
VIFNMAIRETAQMQFPVEISFHGVDRSEALEADVRDHVAKLREFCDRLTSCHVVIERPHRHHRKGNVFQVRVRVHVPRRELVVDREPGENHAHADPYVAVRDAFKAMRRQLEDYAREIRGDVKTHAAPPHGRIVQLRPEANYGLIETPEGRQIYFHRNSLLNSALEQLEIGAEVAFHEEEGEKGPQASSVQRIDGRRHAQAGERSPADRPEFTRGSISAVKATPQQSAAGRAGAGTPSGDGSQQPGAPSISEEAVRQRAYARWEAAGRPAGDGIDFWLAAEQELSQRS